MSEERHQSSVLVPHTEYELFEKQLDALNRKAEKFGLDPIAVVDKTTQRYFRKYEVEGKDGDILTATLTKVTDISYPTKGEPIIRVYKIDLDYPLVKLGDWRVVAQVESLGSSNLVFSISRDARDNEVAEQYRDCKIGCEHCNTARQRKLGYILASDEGEYKQVGSTCLEDFTGIDPAAALFLAKMYEFTRVNDCYDDLENGSFAGRATAFATPEYLSRVAFLIERDGFISASKARESGWVATYDTAWRLENSEDLVREYWEGIDRHRDMAERVIQWYADKQPADSFDSNVKLLLSGEDILMDRKHLAFAAASVPSYLKHLHKQLEAEKSAQGPSQHIGEKGEKIVTDLSIERVFPFETQWGMQYRINLRDPEGNQVTWKTSSPPQELLELDAVGAKFNAQFKVKDHDEFRGVAQTVVTHLKFKGWVDAPKPAPISEHAEAEPIHTPAYSAEWASLMIFNTQTAAFADLGIEVQSADVIEHAAAVIKPGWNGGTIALNDVNGNPVGVLMNAGHDAAVSALPGALMLKVPLGSDTATGLNEMAARIRSGRLGNGDQRTPEGVYIGDVAIGDGFFDAPSKAKDAEHDALVI